MPKATDGKGKASDVSEEKEEVQREDGDEKITISRSDLDATVQSAVDAAVARALGSEKVERKDSENEGEEADNGRFDAVLQRLDALDARLSETVTREDADDDEGDGEDDGAITRNDGKRSFAGSIFHRKG